MKIKVTREQFVSKKPGLKFWKPVTKHLVFHNVLDLDIDAEDIPSHRRLWDLCDWGNEYSNLSVREKVEMTGEMLRKLASEDITSFTIETKVGHSATREFTMSVEVENE